MRVELRNIALQDADKISKWKSDPGLAKLIMSLYQETSIAEARLWIERNTNDKNQVLNGIYIEENPVSKLVGIVRLMFIDFAAGTAEFGIYIGDTSYQGQGVGGKALDLMLEKAFKEKGLRKIYLRVGAGNAGAIRTYQNKQFITEGILREHYYNNGSFEDVFCMAIFKKDNL
jgi:diamine N-acetyltransferase